MYQGELGRRFVFSGPLLRPIVVSSRTGMSAAFQPTRPPLIFSRPRCMKFIVFSRKSLGIRRPYRSLSADASQMRPSLLAHPGHAPQPWMACKRAPR